MRELSPEVADQLCEQLVDDGSTVSRSRPIETLVKKLHERIELEGSDERLVAGAVGIGPALAATLPREVRADSFGG